MVRKWMSLLFAFALAGVMLVPSARADTANERITMQVKKGPLEIPGEVLTPGRYDLKFVGLDYNVVGVTDDRTGNLIGYFEVTPISRDQRSYQVRLDIAKSAPGAPERLVDFFYPGMKTGYEFEYPGLKVSEMASARQTVKQ